jgi:hypothetical protein
MTIDALNGADGSDEEKLQLFHVQSAGGKAVYLMDHGEGALWIPAGGEDYERCNLERLSSSRGNGWFAGRDKVPGH